ncbi:MAG: TetR/AcrR family transcriptional regulator [Deltaproteobacteria bacterium]|nr:TetR/AcrR family transcriptional regulator [Deltaproteobacteria bacterium]
MADTDMKAERRVQILKAAEKLFARHGLKKTSMDDIAEAVGLVKTSLYYYFNSKEELFQTVIRHESETLIKRLQAEINKHSSPQRKLRAYFITRMEYLKELVNLSQLTKIAAQELLPLAEEERHRFIETEKKLVLEILEEGSQSNIFEIGDPEFAAVAIIASMRGLEPTLLLYQDRQLSMGDYEAMLNVLFYGILKG